MDFVHSALSGGDLTKVRDVPLTSSIVAVMMAEPVTIQWVMVMRVLGDVKANRARMRTLPELMQRVLDASGSPELEFQAWSLLWNVDEDGACCYHT